MTIKAIETLYKGYRFRSRLEARWAVFFEAAGIEWKYEPQGFEKTLESGKVLRYLPDFYLPRSETWVEVKGSEEQLQEVREELEALLNHPCPLPGIDHAIPAWCEQCGKCSEEPIYEVHGLLILGEIPEPQRGFMFHPFVSNRLAHGSPFDGAGAVSISRLEWGSVCLQNPTGLYRLGAEAMWYLNFVRTSDMHLGQAWSTKVVFVPSTYVPDELIEPYRAARSARFEHGESP